MRSWVLVLCCSIALGALGALGACSNKKTDDAKASDKAAPASAAEPAKPGAAAAGSDPWEKKAGGGETREERERADEDDDDGAQMPADDGGEAPTPTEAIADEGGGAAAGTPIERLCARDAKCGCPIKDCVAFFEKANLPTEVVECFVTQSCESLCAKNSGAPGSDLHAACMEGKMPATGGGGGGAGSTCRSDRDCPAQHDCCGGFCYQMGTQLWITSCQMPSGKF